VEILLISLVTKASGASDAKGHNVVALGNKDEILTVPPSGSFGHPTSVTNDNLRCAGKHGCHGRRVDDTKTGLQQLKGAHHMNVDGKCDTATAIYNSYRFLRNVKGLENTTDRWQNKDENSHNEYFGATTPMSGDITNCYNCHDAHDFDMTFPANHTISGFCGTCHGNFHLLEGIGGDTVSPFTRHPTDIILPNSGEYSAYTTYSVEAPVARYNGGTVPDTISPTVTPGTDDAIIMCLSCHAAHGTDYPDILRWDYSDMIAGDNSKSGGCFTCHTQKNQTP
jgi:predicted CXXCH cytochrome family protein